MKLVLFTVGRPKTAYIIAGLKDYANRLKFYGGGVN